MFFMRHGPDRTERIEMKMDLDTSKALFTLCKFYRIPKIHIVKALIHQELENIEHGLRGLREDQKFMDW